MNDEPGTTFYTVSDARFFAGTVALVNSLRLVGHEDPVVVMDNGLTAVQRSLLGAHVDVWDVPDACLGRPAQFLKTYPAFAELDGIVSLIDSDMILTAHLAPALELARAARIVVFPDHRGDEVRWYPEWSATFALRAELRRETYVNAGFVTFSSRSWPGFLARWDDAVSRIPEHGYRVPGSPFRDGDQDALNAILMSEVPRAATALLPYDREVHFDRMHMVRVDDPRTLRCSLDGEPVWVLHHSLGPKVWRAGGWRRLTGGEPDAYAVLLTRLLFGEDVPLRLSPRDVPVWLRPGGARALRSVRGLTRAAGGVRRRLRGARSRQR